MAGEKEQNKPSTLAAISSSLNTRFGEHTAVIGTDMPEDPPRLPTGIYIFDHSSGGGFPIHQVSIIKGAEHGGKTSLIMSAMSKVPKICWRCYRPLSLCKCSLPPVKMRSMWLDVEGTFNKFWAKCIGCNPEDYYLNTSESGNEYGDVADYALRADDCGLLVIDSIAALLPSEIMESSLDSKNVALQAKLITNLMNKVNTRLARERKREHPCLVIVTNQLRANIGGFSMFGPPTPITPGGHALKHFSGITVNISKKTLTDKDKYHDKERDLTLAQKHSFYIEKYKSLKLSEGGEFLRITADIPELEFKRGDVADFKYVASKLLDSGLMSKTSNGKYKFENNTGAQKDFVDAWKKNRNLYFEVQHKLLSHTIEKIIPKEPANCQANSVKSAEKKLPSPPKT